jgi:hypothetical protein
MGTIAPHLRAAVRQRARFRCEYCLFPEGFAELRFQVDHVVPLQHGGPTILENLALACFRCNKHKGPNLSGFDPQTGHITRLFNPRDDAWPDHFRWDGARLIGLSAIGRATINLIQANRADSLLVREALMAEGVYFGSPADQDR